MSEIVVIESAEQSTALTMTSREIATLVEGQHSNVKTSIERLVELEIIDAPTRLEYLDSLGRKGQFEYVIKKRDSYVVVAQNSPKFTARLVDRWQELEVKVQEQTLQLLELTKGQLKIAHRETDNYQRKAEYLESEKLTRAYAMDEAKLTNIKQIKVQSANSEQHVKNITGSMRIQADRADTAEAEISRLKSDLRDTKDHLARMTSDCKYFKMRLDRVASKG